jgi:hypothetical protein
MTRTTILALMTVGLLSACTEEIGMPPFQPGMDEDYSHSVGFTGIGSERNYFSH